MKKIESNVILSGIMGSIFGFCGYLIFRLIGQRDAGPMAIFCGLIFTILLFIFLIIYQKKLDKRYERIEKAIVSPVFHKCNGNFNLSNGRVKNGNIYFCEDGIIFVGLEEKPYAYEGIRLQDIKRFEGDIIHLNIYAKDGRTFLITLSNANEVVDILIKKGWIS